MNRDMPPRRNSSGRRGGTAVQSKDIVVYGAGGFAREVAWLAAECGSTVVGFIDDNPAMHGQKLNDIHVMGLKDVALRFPHAAVAIGIGSPAVREAVAAKAKAAGLRDAVLIDPR